MLTARPSAAAAQEVKPLSGIGDARLQPALSLMSEFENRTVLRPSDFSVAGLTTMFDQVIAWSQALPPRRAPAARL